MRNYCQKHLCRLTWAAAYLLSAAFIFSGVAFAQTTAFSYQGRLNTSGNPATGTYEMQFQLFDSVKGGNQIGATFTDASVAVANGVFTTTLDFGAAAFDGSPRFLEIGVRPANDPNPFTLLSPRQSINSVPYAVRSVNAANASQLGGVDASEYVTTTNGATNFIQNSTTQQAGASLNIDGNGTVGSLDANGPVSMVGTAEPAPAPAGQGRIYFDAATNKVKVSENSGAFVDLVGASGVSGSGTTNAIPLWSGGTTLGNSLITQSANGVQLPNGVQLAPGTNGNVVAFGSPNSETGMTMSGSLGRADIRFDGTTLRLLSGPAGSPPSNGVAISPTNVQLPNGVQLGAGTNGHTVAFGSPNSETGLTISGSGGRADLRYDGTLKLVNGTGGIPPATNGIAIDTSGNVGIGTTTPIAKLDVENSQAGKSAVFGKETGTNGVGTYGEATAPSGVGVFARNLNGFAVYADGAVYANGNVSQARDKGGFGKAMVQIHYDGDIPSFVRCYNGVAGLSGGQCGFNYDHYSDLFGLHTTVNFGFTVNDRFISATGTGVNVETVWAFPNSFTVDILSRGNDGSTSASDVYIFVF